MCEHTGNLIPVQQSAGCTEQHEQTTVSFMYVEIMEERDGQ